MNEIRLSQSLISTSNVTFGTVEDSDGLIGSNPPTGKCKVTNFYVDIVTGKFIVEYNDVPV